MMKKIAILLIFTCLNGATIQISNYVFTDKDLEGLGVDHNYKKTFDFHIYFLQAELAQRVWKYKGVLKHHEKQTWNTIEHVYKVFFSNMKKNAGYEFDLTNPNELDPTIKMPVGFLEGKGVQINRNLMLDPKLTPPF